MKKDSEIEAKAYTIYKLLQEKKISIKEAFKEVYSDSSSDKVKVIK